MSKFKQNSAVNYDTCLDKLKRFDWALDDVFTEDSSLDFSKTFMPKTLTMHHRLSDEINDEEKLYLNQLMAKSYLNIFYFVEEYIITDTKNLSASYDNHSIEKHAIDQFHAQEIKHQALFKRIISNFDKNFIGKTKVLDCEKEVADIILSNSRLAILLTTLHLEIITQDHYLHSVKNNDDIDENIIRILKYHWIEEAQHTNVDYLELVRYIEEANTKQLAKSIDEYENILITFDELLAIQAQYDIDSLESCCALKFTPKEYINLQNIQHMSYSNIFILRGLENPKFNRIIETCLASEVDKIQQIRHHFRKLCSV
jgi:hypothetical protein